MLTNIRIYTNIFHHNHYYKYFIKQSIILGRGVKYKRANIKMENAQYIKLFIIKALGAKTLSLSYHCERRDSYEMVRSLQGALYCLEWWGLIDIYIYIIKLVYIYIDIYKICI